MKTLVFSIAAALATVLTANAAESTVKLTEVHLCCDACVTGAEKVIATVKGTKGEADQDTKTITLAAADTATLQKATDALIEAGFFGKSSDSAVKVNAATGAKNEKVKSLQVAGVHLCCGACVTAVNKAVKSVEGVEKHTAVKNAKTFEVTGDFNDKAVFDALQKAGLTGKVAK